MNLFKVVVALIISVTLFACGDDAKKENSPAQPEVKTVDTAVNDTKHATPEINSKFKDPKNRALFNQYLKMQNALVNSDYNATNQSAILMMTAFANIGVDEVYLKAVQDIMMTDDIELQRKNFVVVTQGVEKQLEGALDSGKIYKIHCPMAFGNTGASWLSSEKAIQNPYFGDKMLKCGRVEGTIE